MKANIIDNEGRYLSLDDAGAIPRWVRVPARNVKRVDAFVRFDHGGTLWVDYVTRERDGYHAIVRVAPTAPSQTVVVGDFEDFATLTLGLS